MTRPCPTCNGEGVIKSEETIAIEFERRMRDLASETKAEALLLQMNPRVSAEFTGNGARALHAIEEATGKWFHFEGSEGLPMEHFAVLMEADREKVLERALPFREGEEVHVELVEPHMYSPGDAVAKIDGYIIAVKNADRFVGEKLLVRIEDVGRTEAVAVLVREPELPARAPAAAPSRPRSRRKPAAAKAAPASSGRADSSAEDGSDDAAEEASRAAAIDAARKADELDETENVMEELAPALRDEASDGEIISEDDDPVEDGESEDGVESTPRRRGRRGGRRRSGARAETASGTPSSSE
jgi:ribonuclease G